MSEPFSEAQIEAIARCRSILDSVGLPSLISSPPTSATRPVDVQPRAQHPAVSGSCYKASAAVSFSDTQLDAKENVVSRETKCTAIVRHPLHALVDYPESGSTASERVLHVFEIDPQNFSNPSDAFQYSFNESHGQNKVTTALLCDADGVRVQCIKRHGRCTRSLHMPAMQPLTPIRRQLCKDMLVLSSLCQCSFAHSFA